MKFGIEFITSSGGQVPIPLCAFEFSKFILFSFYYNNAGIINILPLECKNSSPNG